MYTQRKGIWIDDKTAVDFGERDTRSLSDEIATRAHSIDYYSLAMYLPNPDKVLKALGKDQEVYSELIVDAHVGACVESRAAGVTSLLWEIDRGKSKSRQAKFIEAIFKTLPVRRIITEMLNAPLYGYQPLEVIWGSDGSQWVPTDVIAKPSRWFQYDEQNALRFRTKANWSLGEEIPAKKFLVPRHRPTYDNPYGFAILSRCFWWVTFKKGGMKYWVKLAEKVGIPHLVGKHPRGAKREEVTALLDMLQNMVQDAVAAIPDDCSIDTLEATTKAESSDLFKALKDTANAEISKAILGQTLTTEIGDKGSYAASQTHADVRADIVDSDKTMVEEQLNTLIDWICEFNFGPGTERPRFILYAEEDVDKTLAERDEILSRTGVKFTKTHYVQGYGLAEDEFDIAAPAAPTPAGAPVPTPATFAEFASQGARTAADQDLLDSAASAIPDAELQNQAEGLLKPIIALFNNGSSFEEVQSAMVAAHPDMDITSLAEMMARARFVSEVWGRLNA